MSGVNSESDFDATNITQNYDQLDFRKHRDKWQTKGEFEKVRVVRDRFRRMQIARRTSCPWAAIVTNFQSLSGVTPQVVAGVGTGSNWVDRWNIDYKQWSMWHEYLQGRSNLKSPIAFAPIEAAMAEFQENSIGVTLTPTREDDKQRVKIIQYALEHLDAKMDAGITKEETFHECLITGTAVTYTGWMNRTREVDVILGSREIEDKIEKSKNKDKSKLKDKLESGKPISEKRDKVDHDDIMDIPVSIYEFFVDPDARVMRGGAYDARDCIWRTTPGIEEFLADFRKSKDPYVISANVEKVRPAFVAERMYYEGLPFFRAPSDIAQKQKVELIKYYNKDTDKYIVVANDILVRYGPMPYNHKELPFSVHRFIKWPHMFYGIGLPVILESLQAEDETLRNMMLDQMTINLNPPILINSDIFNDIDQGWDRIEPGLKVEVAGSVGSENIRWFEGSQYRPDYFQMRNQIREDAVVTSGINPLAYSVPKPGEAVRNNVMGLEATLKMLKKGIKNWAEGQKDVVRQHIALMQQFYPESKLKRLDPRSGKEETVSRSIRLDGIELMIKNDGGLEERKADGYRFFELKDDYFDLAGDVDVYIDIDSLVPISRGLKMQKIEQAMAQLIPILGNPNILSAPGVIQIVREYVETHGLSEKITDQLQQEDSDKERQRAIDQEFAMLQGEDIPGFPGESSNHKMQHVMALMTAGTMLNDAGMPGSEGYQKVLQFTENLKKHLTVDDAPRQDASKVAVQVAGAQAQAAQPQMAQPPVPTPPQGAPMMPQGAMPPQMAQPNTAEMLSGSEMGAMQGVGGMPTPGLR